MHTSFLFQQHSPLGYSVANITAHPANSSSAVTYSFIGAGNAAGDFTKFLINPQTGHITVNGDLDYEAKRTFDVSFYCIVSV